MLTLSENQIDHETGRSGTGRPGHRGNCIGRARRWQRRGWWWRHARLIGMARLTRPTKITTMTTKKKQQQKSRTSRETFATTSRVITVAYYDNKILNYHNILRI